MGSSSEQGPNQNQFTQKRKSVTAIVVVIATIVGGIAATPGAIAAINAFVHTQNFWIKAAPFLLLALNSRWNVLRLPGAMSKNEKDYCTILIQKHKALDTSRLSIPGAYALNIEDIFVELNIGPTSILEDTSDPFQIPRPLQPGNHSIWEELSSRRHLVVVGAPGCGKTTLLEHITLTLVENRKQRPKKPRVKIPRLLPILLNLSVYANEINQNSKFSLLDAVQDLMNNEGQLSVPRPWIKDKLSRGKCLILLDGLDEIADAAARDRMSEWVQKQLGVWGKNHFILTSRPYGYIENKLRGVDLKEIQPFTTKQIELFIKQWYLASEIRSQEKEDSAVREKAQNAARDLLRFLYSDTDLLLLAVNPLLLTMIAMVHRESNSIPDKRVKLYAEACEVFLRNHQKAHGVAQVLTSAQIQQVLQHLALHLMEKGEQKIRLTDAQKVIAEPMREAGVDMQPEKFLQLVQNTSGLLLKHEPKTYSFAHLSFQAYLAAVAINKEDEKKKEATLNTEKSEQKEAYLISKVREKWWHETIRFYCALEDDATALINECLKEDTLSVSTLILAHDCIEEARSFKPSVRDQLETLVDEGIEHPDPNRRRIIGEVLLKQNLRNMIYLHEGVLIDQKLVTCAEYQVFLDEQNANGLCNQPYHWNTKSFPVGEGRDPILGVQPLDVIAFCHWLTKQDESLAWLYRLPKEEEHNIIKRDLSSTLKLKPETGYWVNEGEKFVWANEIAQLPDDLESSIRKLWNKDWTRDRISDQEFDLARILNNVRDHISDLNEKKDFSLDGGIIRDQDITRAVSLLCALNLTHIQGIDFNPINLRKQTL